MSCIPTGVLRLQFGSNTHGQCFGHAAIRSETEDRRKKRGTHAQPTKEVGHLEQESDTNLGRKWVL